VSPRPADRSTEPGLSIREVAARTGVEAPTLRMWEQRHGVPRPQRLPSGHRRYSEADVELIDRVVRERAAGLELPAAIAAAQRAGAAPAAEEDSIHAGLRRRRPELDPYLLPKRVLISMSHAIEDECGVSGQRAMLFASFQRERYYRCAEARWRDLAGPARCALVLADFAALREPAGAPAEVPIDRTDPLGREWSVICDGPALAALLSAWERPGQDDVPDAERRFETVWSVDRTLVRHAALVASEIVARSAPHLTEPIRSALAEPAESGVPGSEAIESLTNRMVAYVGGARPPRAPHPSATA
jgi:DICT domain-containing protein/predicted DNA-binding transcriptional regulator AlpA